MPVCATLFQIILNSPSSSVAVEMFLTQRNPTEKANAVADAINAAESGRALAVVGDVLDGNYITELVKRAAEFGGGKIHIIVNNAGFTWDGVIHKVSELLEFSFFSPFSPGPLVHTH